MGDKTKIEWTDATWTPIRARAFEPQDDGSGKERIGWHCEHVSEGCRSCYAESVNRRLGTGLDFKPGDLFRADRVGYSNGEAKVFLDETMLLAPLRWQRPRMIFVCSMTDLFGDWVPDEMIDKVLSVIVRSNQHIFQVLTKRMSRARAYFSELARLWACDPTAVFERFGWSAGWMPTFPIANLWLGTSCEDQPTADARIPDLLATPAAIRFVSSEPLLAPIDFSRWMPGSYECAEECGWRSGNPPREEVCHHCGWISTCEGEFCSNCGQQDFGSVCPKCEANVVHCHPDTPCLDWVIVGGESGPHARPMHPDWARLIRDQCAAAGVAFHFKQHGEWLFEDQVHDGQHPGKRFFGGDGSPIDEKPPFGPVTGRLWYWWNDGSFASIRVGKKRAGRRLDGVEHDGMPSAS